MILLLDNYDSFVHNLARYLRCLDCDTRVVRSDRITVAECRDLKPEAILISPGPRRPEQAGCSVDVIRQLSAEIPMLGVCLGLQSIGVAFGARIVTTPPMHGMASTVTHGGGGLFAGCPSPLRVGRYHSLAIDPHQIPEDLEITATTDDGVIMAVRHRVRPTFGVQFHPESILTENGATILKNFLGLARGEGSANPGPPKSAACGKETIRLDHSTSLDPRPLAPPAATPNGTPAS